ncbi:hypothetical protein [Jatrophihabitans sp.]|uniref:hypothetical protein n=1 Tax=Jatrophihabitans sp. TaxID=1932789 RepID=UPI0030C77ADE|nr:hypothetical protein [Jatrophihabitans sp.]
MVDLSEPHAVRVKCPVCGSHALLRFVVRGGHKVEPIGLSCPNQTSREHETPTPRQLEQLAAEVRLP